MGEKKEKSVDALVKGKGSKRIEQIEGTAQRVSDKDKALMQVLRCHRIPLSQIAEISRFSVSTVWTYTQDLPFFCLDDLTLTALLRVLMSHCLLDAIVKVGEGEDPHLDAAPIILKYTNALKGLQEYHEQVGLKEEVLIIERQMEDATGDVLDWLQKRYEQKKEELS